MPRHCAARGCYERVAIDERLCSSHSIGMAPAVERALNAAERRVQKGTEPKPARREVKSGPMVPLHVSWRYRYAGVTPRMLDWWRAKGWLGRQAEGSGYQYDWDDPAVMFQCRWLAQLHQAGHELTDEDAAAGFRLRSYGTEYAVKVDLGEGYGLCWEPADEDWILALVEVGASFTVARVSALARTASVTDGPVTGAVRGSAPQELGVASAVAPIKDPAGVTRRGPNAAAGTAADKAG